MFWGHDFLKPQALDLEAKSFGQSLLCQRACKFIAEVHASELYQKPVPLLLGPKP